MIRKVSFTGPKMAANVTVYLADPYFGEYANGLPVELAFSPGTELEISELSEETKSKIAKLIADGIAVEVPDAIEKGEFS